MLDFSECVIVIIVIEASTSHMLGGAAAALQEILNVSQVPCSLASILQNLLFLNGM